jgi:hypothetical protein
LSRFHVGRGTCRAGQTAADYFEIGISHVFVLFVI